MPDIKNGGVLPAEHHQQHHYGATVLPQNNGVEDPNMYDPRQIHQYGHVPNNGQPVHGMPYPRFPPYDRMDIRHAAYYGAQQGGMEQYPRPDSPSMGHMGQNGHQTPVVYTSCKLQAAVGNGIISGPESPTDLVDPSLNNHHHHQHHHMNHHPQPHPQQPPQQQPPQHMMYAQQPPPQHHQVVVNPHQQTPPNQPPSQPPNQPPNQQPNNTSASLPSPLYPWMRSQFGKSILFSFSEGFLFFYDDFFFFLKIGMFVY